MKFTPAALALPFAVLTLGMAACTQADQDAAQSDAAEAGDALGEEASQVGDAIESGVRDAADSEAAGQIREEAGQLGDAAVSGAREAASNFDQATDELAADADRRDAEREARTPPAN